MFCDLDIRILDFVFDWKRTACGDGYVALLQVLKVVFTANQSSMKYTYIHTYTHHVYIYICTHVVITLDGITKKLKQSHK